MRQYEDLLIDALLDDGFTLEEAVRLITLQERAQKSLLQHPIERPYDTWSDDHSGHRWN